MRPSIEGRPMDSDAIREALAPYLADVDILRYDVGGCTVKPFRSFEDDEGFLRWYEINDAINKLGGSWIRATKYTKGHWRIPRDQSRDLDSWTGTYRPSQRIFPKP